MLSKRCACADPGKCDHPYHYVFVLRGHRYRGTTRTSNVRTADRIATKHKHAVIEDGEGLSAPKPIRLSAHCTAYVAHTAKTNTTSYKDKAVLDRLQEEIGDKFLLEIRPFDLERWKSSRAEEVEKSTVNRELNIVRGCFSRAVEWGSMTKSPAGVVDSYKVDDQRVRVLTDDELSTVLAIPDPFVVLLCRTTLESLARISELLGLHTSHIGASWVEMRKKGGKMDRVHVTPETRTALLAHAHGESGYVFGEGATGKPPTQQTASNRVLRALQSAGLTDASHHTMRHTGVTLMLEQGINPRVIQKLAGWSSLRMLERYGHARDAEAVRAVRQIASHLDDAVTHSGPAQSVATK